MPADQERTGTLAARLEHHGRRLGELADRLSRPIGLVLSLALLAVVLRQAREADWSMLAGDARLTAPFWLAFLGYYFLSPLIEWLIYSRLWGFDWRTLPALLRKLVSNELLLDYVGDVQFLAWAQSRKLGNPSPFGAIKDMTVLSAVTGNLVTIVLAVLAWPYLVRSLSGVPLQPVLASFAVVLAISSLVPLLGKRLFSHPARTLWWIAALLAGRTTAGVVLGAVMWHMLMPQSSLTALVVLATLRMVVSRLPLVPSKELLFAGLAVIAFGRAADISGVTAMIASLVLVCHIAIGASLTLAHLAASHAGWWKRGAGPQ